MAYYAELKRRHWYCINQENMIKFYKKFLHEQWYSSLTDEQRNRLAEARKQRDAKRDAEFNAAMERLAYLSSMFYGKLSKNNFSRYMK